LDDISAIEPSLNGISETERVTLIAARLGQGLFRQRLMHVWRSRCAVTGISVAALLRASHIKPWRLSSNNERLDPENGLLLVANLDAAFDAGLVSFSDDGAILFSTDLGSIPHGILGIQRDAKLTQQPSPRQQEFLKHHRAAAGI
jgi:predicted restriction endonuclease